MRKINGKTPTGRLNEAKLDAMRGLVEGVLSGSQSAIGRLKEHWTTGDDSIFAFAYLANVQVLEMFDEAPRVWDQIATTKSYTSFSAPTKYAATPVIEGLERPQTEPGKPGDVAPIVPEGAPYPTFVFSGEVLEGGALKKRGAKFELTWEKIVDDAENLVPQIPGLITETFLNAEEWEVFSALRAAATTARQLAAGTNLDGTTVPANAPLSREALIQALSQVKTREVNGRRIRLGSFNLVVPIGMAETANFYMNSLRLTSITDSDLEFSVGGYNPLTAITGVVESEYVDSGEWFLVPAKGSTGSRPALELMKLSGHEQIELRVEGATGSYLGGGAVSPFEGSFDTDGAAFRGRYPINGASWLPDSIIWSDGSGS